MGKNSPNKQECTKANALLCPTCCVEYVEVEFLCEIEGCILTKVKALMCPSCEEEVFTAEQWEVVSKRISYCTKIT